jgi:hypothetical protein
MPAGLQPEAQPDDPPIDLEVRGRQLAEDHRRHAGVRSGSAHPVALFSARLPRFNSLLKEAADRFQAQTSKAGQLTSAAEWLLDNYYIAAQALR